MHWTIDVKRRILNMMLLTLGLVSVTGCNSLSDSIDEQHYLMRSKSDAGLAWKNSKRAYVRIEKNLDDFERGFVDGYVAVASGADGCPPSLPPKRYWKTKYSNVESKELVVAWFDGYQHGATTAIADGVKESRQILTSGKVYNKTKAHVEYEPSSVQDDFQHANPVIVAPLPESPGVFPGEASKPVIKKRESAPTPAAPPAKPYVPEEVKKK